MSWIEWNQRAMDNLISFIKTTGLFAMSGYLPELGFYIITFLAIFSNDPKEAASHIAI